MVGAQLRESFGGRAKADGTDLTAVNKDGRSQPWIRFIKTDADVESARESDFITVRNVNVHDYTAQLG